MNYTAHVRSKDNVAMKCSFFARTGEQADIAARHMEQWAATKTERELYGYDYVRANPYNVAVAA